MSKASERSEICMDTVVTIKVVSQQGNDEVESAMKRAFALFHRVENVFSRFDPESEVSRLTHQTGVAAPVSHMLFEALRFSLEVAELTEGRFDPTVGYMMESHGFNKHYLTGNKQQTFLDADTPVSYRDIRLDPLRRTVFLHRPLVIDLGAVVKGLAIDLAVQELQPFDGYLVNAGGDIYAGGCNEDGQPWRVGIQHPTEEDRVLCTLTLTDQAVCTSGRYERKSPKDHKVHHLIDPRSGKASSELWSCTVVAPFAMLADTFSTAAFIQGPDEGFRLLEQEGLEGVMVKSSLELKATKGMKKYGYECPRD